LLDSQRISAKFCHDIHPRRSVGPPIFYFLSLATLAECCQNTDFGKIRCGFEAILLME